MRISWVVWVTIKDHFGKNSEMFTSIKNYENFLEINKDPVGLRYDVRFVLKQ